MSKKIKVSCSETVYYDQTIEVSDELFEELVNGDTLEDSTIARLFDHIDRTDASNTDDEDVMGIYDASKKPGENGFRVFP